MEAQRRGQRAGMEAIAWNDVVPTVAGYLGFAAAWRLSTLSRLWPSLITPELLRKVRRI